jgi:hypothetical protein
MGRSPDTCCRSIGNPAPAEEASTDTRANTEAWDRSRDWAASASCSQGMIRGSGKPFHTTKGGLEVRTRTVWSYRRPEQVSRVVGTKRRKSSDTTDRRQYTCFLEKDHVETVSCCCGSFPYLDMARRPVEVSCLEPGFPGAGSMKEWCLSLRRHPDAVAAGNSTQ